jgi:hypothetical protein
MKEIWKPVVGYESLYAVSDQGRVKRVKLYLNSKKEPLTPVFDGKHYLRVSLSKNNKAKGFSIHRIVADAFIGIPTGMVVNHLNGDKFDNRLENLEVCTFVENERHKWDVLKTGGRGKAKLTWEQVADIRAMRGSGMSLSKIASQFNIGKANVSFIVNNKTWVRHPPTG